MLLRVLEYYQGILILSKSRKVSVLCPLLLTCHPATNRIRDFDVAVQSRIHLAIKYEDLTREQQVQVFHTFLSQAHEKGHVEDWGRVCKWVDRDGTSNQSKFNGRQIRNIVTSAMGLARAGDRKLTSQDLGMGITAKIARVLTLVQGKLRE